MLLGNYAERVRFVRSLTKLSREAFESKYGINRNTLKSWELGINTLTEKSAIQIADAIKSEGFSCSPEWLIFGMGPEPRSFNADDSLLDAISEQSKIIYEAEYFKKNNENSIVSMITDLSMFPNYEVGDYVGGVIEDN
ncbi:MAG: helix-turn-helix domain-containing protein, partial [Gammaproteobacteria bacterium]